MKKHSSVFVASAAASASSPMETTRRGTGSCRGIAVVCALALGVMIPVGTSLADVAEVYTKLGNGGCRTPRGTQGNYIPVEDVSFEQCRAYCDEAPKHNKRCWGFEYNPRSHSCELHTKEIAFATGKGPSVCYKNVCTGNGKTC